MIFFKHVFIIKLIFLAFINFSNAETEYEKALRISTDAYNYDKGFGDFTSDSKMTLRNKQGLIVHRANTKDELLKEALNLLIKENDLINEDGKLILFG